MSRRGRRLLKVGIVLLIVGAGPLFAIIIAASLGLTRDPNPNPVGFGILAGVTFWPSIIMIVWGVVSIRREKADPLAAPQPYRTTSLKPDSHDQLPHREASNEDR